MRLTSRTLLIAAATLGIGAVAATSAFAASLPNPIPCASRAQTTPFSKFNDFRSYWLLPRASFESGTDWTLSGPASVVAGNESYYLNAKTDRYSLKLSPGSVATTRAFCIGSDSPVVRFLARNAGSASGTLRIDLIYEDQGVIRTVFLTSLTRGDGNWFASPILTVNYSRDLVTKGTANIELRFTPSGGAWQLDDFYVDPFKGY